MFDSEMAVTSFPNLNMPEIKNPVLDTNRILAEIQKEIMRSTLAGQKAAVASLAGGMIAASGRAHSVEEALALLTDLQFALYPAHGYGVYAKWKEELGDRLKQPHT